MRTASKASLSHQMKIEERVDHENCVVDNENCVDRLAGWRSFTLCICLLGNSDYDVVKRAKSYRQVDVLCRQRRLQCTMLHTLDATSFPAAGVHVLCRPL